MYVSEDVGGERSFCTGETLPVTRAVCHQHQAGLHFGLGPWIHRTCAMKGSPQVGRVTAFGRAFASPLARCRSRCCALAGAGLGRLDAAIIFEELAWGCVPTAAFLSIHNMVAAGAAAGQALPAWAGCAPVAPCG